MRTCDQVNAFLSTFGSYTHNYPSRCAYEVKPNDKVEYFTATRAKLFTAKGTIEFSTEPGQKISLGDFIELIRWPDCAVHWQRRHFLAQTAKPETVINRGDVVLENYPRSDRLNVAGYVIKIKDRYFSSFHNGKVMTAWSLAGAQRFCQHHDGKKLQKTLAELAARKKKTQVLEVGMWSRTVEQVQGGAV